MYKLKLTATLGLLLLITVITANAQDHSFDPPWNTPPDSKLQFTVQGIDNVPDLYGDINDPQLVIFFAGNQFMAVDQLLAAFKAKYPQYQRVFAETLPPGILAKQIEVGSVAIGNMRITLKPDIYTAGKSAIEKTPDMFSRTEPYASNKLAIMVKKDNPKQIKGLADLGKKDVRVSMPNLQTEGIGAQIMEAYNKAGGKQLQDAIMEDKVKDGSTYLTKIHHRETPMRILYDNSDAGPVWYTEVYYQQMIGHPIDLVEIPASDNVIANYVAASLKTAPHQQAAKDFLDFMISPEAKAVYKKFGFIVK
ncbi:substrate-binding domain-containing protein [Mucilaginibacter sp. dw_454]|uniref:molybdate ABC transporter substrate-binding protein n=1 Tax=Mucilaginibacter sp. dw_454 TaxID=2720079 RepID=UPI001BD211E7|nr:substrate-binding domain-containing protein [Mucilaginibacter sp. dw_454]